MSPHHGFSASSFIRKGRYNQPDNPDKRSLDALQKIIENPKTTNSIRDIAFNHIMRINNYSATLIVEIENLAPCIKNSNDKNIYS